MAPETRLTTVVPLYPSPVVYTMPGAFSEFVANVDCVVCRAKPTNNGFAVCTSVLSISNSLADTTYTFALIVDVPVEIVRVPRPLGPAAMLYDPVNAIGVGGYVNAAPVLFTLPLSLVSI